MPEKVESYVAAVCGYVSGKYRIIEGRRFGRCIRAKLQRPCGGSWETVASWMLGAVMLSPADLIRDNYGRLGIVLWEASTPDESWLKIQKDSRMRSVGACRWWSVALLIGGGVCVPEPLAEYVRPATVDDALQVAREHKMSYFTLVKVFPQLAELMLPPVLE